MQPKTSGDAYKPKWRHFHPQSRVWLMNPFPHEVHFYVADESNVQYKYILPGNTTSELPGGMIATLGVKTIVDEMIQNNSQDVLRIWDEEVRKKYEDKVIKKYKEAPENRFATNGAKEINLGMTYDEDESDQPEVKTNEEEPAFPELAESSVDETKPDIEPAFTSSGPQVIEED